MADNITLNSGTGGDSLAADEVGGAKFQRVKLIHGADGTNDGDVSSANGLPVDGSGVTQPVSGTVTANPASGTIDTVTTVTTVTNDVNIADGGNSITVDNGGTFAVQSTLQTGSNAIGKLAANSGVDIGDVDVTSLPAELSGPGTPTIDSYTSAAINVATGANNSIVSAPGANKQIWVYGLTLLANVAGSFSLQDEDDTALTGVMPIATTGGFVMPPSGNFAMPWFKVATNKALEIDAVTCTADGIVSYAVVSV